MIKTLLTAFTLTTLITAGQAHAQAQTPRIDKRQAAQERRIDQGIASGELTRREAIRLKRKQNRIDRAEDRAKADGVVTRRERVRLHGAQNRASRDIYRQKHDRQDRPNR